MSEAAVTQRGTRAPGDDRAFARADWRAPDARRRLQLALGALWLLDAILQYQPVMFTRAFSQMLAAAAQGNPAFVSRPILWDAHLVGQHPVALNTSLRHHPAAAGPRHRLAAHGQARAGGVDRLGPGRVVVR